MVCSAGYVGALYVMFHVSLSPSPSPLPAIQARPRSVQTHKKLISNLERSVHLTHHMASRGALCGSLDHNGCVCACVCDVGGIVYMCVDLVLL